MSSLCVANKSDSQAAQPHKESATTYAVSTERMVSSVGCTTQTADLPVPCSRLPVDLTSGIPLPIERRAGITHQ